MRRALFLCFVSGMSHCCAMQLQRTKATANTAPAVVARSLRQASTSELLVRCDFIMGQAKDFQDRQNYLMVMQKLRSMIAFLSGIPQIPAFQALEISPFFDRIEACRNSGGISQSELVTFVDALGVSIKQLLAQMSKPQVKAKALPPAKTSLAKSMPPLRQSPTSKVPRGTNGGMKRPPHQVSPTAPKTGMKNPKMGPKVPHKQPFSDWKNGKNTVPNKFTPPSAPVPNRPIFLASGSGKHPSSGGHKSPGAVGATACRSPHNIRAPKSEEAGYDDADDAEEAALIKDLAGDDDDEEAVLIKDLAGDDDDEEAALIKDLAGDDDDEEAALIKDLAGDDDEEAALIKDLAADDDDMEADKAGYTARSKTISQPDDTDQKDDVDEEDTMAEEEAAYVVPRTSLSRYGAAEEEACYALPKNEGNAEEEGIEDNSYGEEETADLKHYIERQKFYEEEEAVEQLDYQAPQEYYGEEEEGQTSFSRSSSNYYAKEEAAEPVLYLPAQNYYEEEESARASLPATAQTYFGQQAAGQSYYEEEESSILPPQPSFISPESTPSNNSYQPDFSSQQSFSSNESFQPDYSSQSSFGGGYEEGGW